jgi:hypothetical protein
MRIRRVDQDASFPINPFQGIGDAYPSGRKNNDVAFGCLLLGPGNGTGTEIGDKTSQRFRPPGIGYDQGVTGHHQMTAKRASYGTGTNKSYFHSQSPSSDGLAKEHAIQKQLAL